MARENENEMIKLFVRTDHGIYGWIVCLFFHIFSLILPGMDLFISKAFQSRIFTFL